MSSLRLTCDEITSNVSDSDGCLAAETIRLDCESVTEPDSYGSETFAWERKRAVLRDLDFLQFCSTQFVL